MTASLFYKWENGTQVTEDSNDNSDWEVKEGNIFRILSPLLCHEMGALHIVPT